MHRNAAAAAGLRAAGLGRAGAAAPAGPVRRLKKRPATGAEPGGGERAISGEGTELPVPASGGREILCFKAPGMPQLLAGPGKCADAPGPVFKIAAQPWHATLRRGPAPLPFALWARTECVPESLWPLDLTNSGL